MKFTTTASAAAFAALITSAVAVKEERTFAVLHFTNKQLTKGRMDPIVSPGKVSNHVHSVMGASNFGLSSTGEDLVDSNCTNAKVKGDMSNYWYPALYFKDPETGKFEDVELFYTNAYYLYVLRSPYDVQLLTYALVSRQPTMTSRLSLSVCKWSVAMP